MSQVQMENKGKVRGDSAYEIAVKDGFVGTEAEWLESLKGSSYDDTEIKQSITDLDNSKVDKVLGKQLSTEDFTTAEKTKLAGLSDNPSGGVEEAPKDGKQYARQNGAWSAVSSSSGSYDDTEVRGLITQNANDIESLENSKADKTQIPNVSGFATNQQLQDLDNAKQETLVSGTNIKTINGQPILGEGDIEVIGGSGGSSSSVLYTEQTLTEEQQAQVSKNIGVAHTDFYAEWEAGTYDSLGNPIDGSIYYVRSKPIDITDTVEFPTGITYISSILHFDENDSFLARNSGTLIDTQSQTAIPRYTGAKKVAFVLYIGSAGGTTSEEKIKTAEKTVFRNNLIYTPINSKSYIRPLEIAASLTLKCAQEFTDDGSVAIANRYLWHDNNFDFYISDSLKGGKRYIFSWSLPDTPDHYSMAFYGNDILAVWATATVVGVQSEDVRRKPYVFQKTKNYAPTEISISGKDYPSNWFANLGYWHNSMYHLGEAYFCEYTRPSVQKAYVWKVKGLATSNSSWSIIHEHDVAQDDSNLGFKHYHHIQKDPYSDWIYWTTGDDDNNCFIYGTKDEGATVELIYGPNQEVCRLLNFVFTPDAIYWASDNPIQDKHSLFKAVRVGDDSRMDVANVERLHRFDHTDGNWNATYCLVYMKALNCLVILDRADSVSENTPVYVWDFETGTMKIAEYMLPLSANALTGFRCTYYSVYPQDNTIAVGYSSSTFAGFAYQNPNKILTNTFRNVANLLLNINRTGDNFSIGFETVR